MLTAPRAGSTPRRTGATASGATQVLTPNWLATVNLEAISGEGFSRQSVPRGRVFGAAVPERVPRTRSSCAAQVRAIGDLGEKNVVTGLYRYHWDTWG